MFPLPLPQSPTNARSHTLCSNVAWLLTQPLVKKIKEKCCSTASSQLSSVSQVSKKTVDSSCLESSSPRANLPYNVPTFLIPLTAVPSHFSFIQHTMKLITIHVHTLPKPTYTTFVMLRALQAWAIHWSRQQNRMSSDNFTVSPKIEYRLRQLSPCNPDTSRCPQKPTCGYNLRPCLYFCFWLEASGYQLLTRLLIPWVLWLSVLIQGFGPFSLGGKLLPPPRHRDPVSLSPNWPPPW